MYPTCHCRFKRDKFHLFQSFKVLRFQGLVLKAFGNFSEVLWLFQRGLGSSTTKFSIFQLKYMLLITKNSLQHKIDQKHWFSSIFDFSLVLFWSLSQEPSPALLSRRVYSIDLNIVCNLILIRYIFAQLLVIHMAIKFQIGWGILITNLQV